MPMTQIVLRIITKQFKDNKVQKLVKEKIDCMKAEVDQNKRGEIALILF